MQIAADRQKNGKHSILAPLHVVKGYGTKIGMNAPIKKACWLTFSRRITIIVQTLKSDQDVV